MSKCSNAELKVRDTRKGLIDPEPRPVASKKGRNILLEYFVEEHQMDGLWSTKAGWNRYGDYKSRGQALRVIEQVKVKQEHRGYAGYGEPPHECKWRINGVEV
jgi:hypothetical protein